MQKIERLKKITHDESQMFVYKDFGTSSCTIKKFTTNMKVLDGHLNKIQELSVKRNIPEEFSPSKKRKKQKYICEVCGIIYDSGRDKEYRNSWVGCDKEGCHVW